MPAANAAGVTLGGGAWFQKDFNISTPSTWDGVVIDPDGDLLGVDNIGVTVWEDGVKRVQIQSGGINVIGGVSSWVPAGWNPSNKTGMAIDSTGLAAYLNNVCTFLLENNGDITIGASGGDQLHYDASTGVLTLPTVSVDFITTEDLIAGSLSTGTGILLDAAGLGGYYGGNLTFVFYSTGNFTIGSTTGKQISFVASTGVITLGKDVTVVDSDSTSRVLGAIAKGGYRASLKLTTTGTISFDDVDDSTFYRKEYVKAWTLDNLGDGVTYLKSYITRAGTVIDSNYNMALAASKTLTIDTSASYGKILFTSYMSIFATSSYSGINSVSGAGTFNLGTPTGRFAYIGYYADTQHTFRIGTTSKMYVANTEVSIGVNLNVTGSADIYAGGDIGCDGYLTSQTGIISYSTIYAAGNCSALSFTDRTPYPDSLQTAYDAVKSMRLEVAEDGLSGKTTATTCKLDHSGLHSFISTTAKNEKGNDVPARDLSATVSCLAECVKYLMEKDGYGKK